MHMCRVNRGQGLVDRKLGQAAPPLPPGILLLAVQRRLFCFGSLAVLMILDVVCCYLCYSCYIYKYRNR